MLLTTEQIERVKRQTAIHAQYMTTFMRLNDFSKVRLIDPNSGNLVRPADMFRRGNDFIGGAYSHALAFDSNDGDDCVDYLGNRLELKLAYVRKKGLILDANGNIARGDKLLEHTIKARFRVYKGTEQGHHNKDTALILVSHDHQTFISGFMLPGHIVQELLMGKQKASDRNISLHQFQTYGHEFGSSVSHIGWDRYRNALKGILAAKQGLVINPDEAWALQPQFYQQVAAAHKEWVALADERNLKRL